jgi:outer membrane protein OmpA-like peptidoglycan-associated protein
MLRMLPLSAAVMVALLSIGCVSTSKNDTPANSAAVNAETAKPQTVFAARLQPVAGVTTAELADNRIKVSFPGITAFSHDGASISDELQRQLSAVVESLKSTTYQNVTVLGHTDSSGQLAYNNKLSQQRAEQVMAFLQQQGLAAEQLVVEGRGPSEPIADNKTAQGRAANRRVEIEVAF